MEATKGKYGAILAGLVLGLGLASLPGPVHGDASLEHRELVRALVELRDELKNIRGELHELNDKSARGMDRLVNETSRIDDALRACAACRR